MVPLLVFISLILIIYGATNPGVPHLTNKYFGSSWNVARPKSQIARSVENYFLKMIFSGFKSLWIIL